MLRAARDAAAGAAFSWFFFANNQRTQPRTTSEVHTSIRVHGGLRPVLPSPPTRLVLPLPRPSLPPTVSIRRSDGIAIHDATLGARLVVRGLALLLPRLRVVRVPHRLSDRVAATDDVQEWDNKHDARDANNPVDGPRKVLILLRNLRQRWWRWGWRAWRGRRGRGRRGRW